jgi:uncharacterized repeat protein (TIGR01451 family)
MKNKKYIMWLLSAAGMLLTCSCQNLCQPPRELYSVNPYEQHIVFPQNMYSGTVPPAHWRNSPMMTGPPQPMFQQPMYEPVPQAVPQQPVYEPIPVPVPQQQVSPLYSPPTLPPKPQTIQPSVPFDLELIPPTSGSDSQQPPKESRRPQHNGKLSSANYDDFIVRGQSPDSEENDPFAAESAEEAAAVPLQIPAEQSAAKDTESQAIEENAEEGTDTAQEIIPRTAPVEVLENAVKEPSVIQPVPEVPMTDFSIRRKEPLTVEPSLKGIGESIPYHPQVFLDRANAGFGPPKTGEPQDEYLADGGDDYEKVRIRQNWEVRGLNPEDTVVHFDTLNHQTRVEPSNRVYIYSPRFGSIRQVHGLTGNIQWQGFATVDHSSRLHHFQDSAKAGLSQQADKTGYTRTQKVLHGTVAGSNTGEISSPKGIVSVKQNDHVRSYTKLLMEKTFSSSTQLYLAQGKQFVRGWDGLDGVTMIVNNLAPMGFGKTKTPEEILVVDNGEATSPKLKVFKIASSDSARQGEIIEFYIRFDNIGTEPVGNLTVMDSLSPRLEYISGSAGSSVPAEFFTEPNEAGTLTLRWEITQPLHAGDFGVVRFRCRVQ